MGILLRVPTGRKAPSWADSYLGSFFGPPVMELLPGPEHNHEFLIFSHANLVIANINHYLSLGLTKTDYQMSFSCEVHSTHVQSLSKKKFEM